MPDFEANSAFRTTHQNTKCQKAQKVWTSLEEHSPGRSGLAAAYTNWQFAPNENRKK